MNHCIMPRFYLHTRINGARIEDLEGYSLPDLEAARSYALHGARHLWAEAIIAERDLIGEVFEIADEEGRVLLLLPFEDALPPALRPATCQ